MATAMNYVKFIRGTENAFKNLELKDKDTLYFIYKDADSTTGKLYLGSKLISGDTASSSALGDIILSNLGNKQILYYDNTKQAWTNGDVAQLISQMVGATELQDGIAGLVPAPTSADKNKFLRGDGTWAEISGSDIAHDQKAFSTNDNTINLLGFDSAELGAVAAKGENGKLSWISQSNLFNNHYTKDEVNSLLNTVNNVSRKRIDSVEDIDINAEDAEKYIYMVPNGQSEGTDIYDEYVVIDGQIEKFGNTAINLEEYVTSEGLTAILNSYVKSETFNPIYQTVADLNEIINGSSDEEGNTVVPGLKSIVDGFSDTYVTLAKYNSEVGDLAILLNRASENSTIVDEINILDARTTWQELK